MAGDAAITAIRATTAIRRTTQKGSSTFNHLGVTVMTDSLLRRALTFFTWANTLPRGRGITPQRRTSLLFHLSPDAKPAIGGRIRPDYNFTERQHRPDASGMTPGSGGALLSRGIAIASDATRPALFASISISRVAANK
jgi:hypothetical protein